MPRREMQTQPKHMRIELEQHDQDFNYFELEYAGIDMGANHLRVPLYRVIEAGPFQNWLWKDKLIDWTTINLECRPGILLNGEWQILSYPITSIHISPN